ncbi:MAG: benzoate 1,2-dioxygenase electron transfer component BenC [Burkholderiales bacterium]|nr:benzoate 1,2-dioxygenase electron transfer component BenC [Burkholderiales bacterium]
MSTYKIALNFEDGVTRFIDCKDSETVADAAYRQKINVPIDCRDGACGACKSSCESGQFDMGSNYIDDALTEEELKDGFVLTCQMRPKSDCVVRIPASSAVCKTSQTSLNTTIKDVRLVSDSTIALTVAGDDIAKLSFLPGQYANLQVPGTDAHRAYSFSSMPKDNAVSFLIRNVPGGLMSGYLTGQAKPGDTLVMNGPKGSFYLRDIIRPVLMLAGGTGLAPFTAMLDKIAAAGGSPFPVHLIYGVNTDTDLVDIDKLAAFAQAMPSFSYALVVVDANSAQPKKGYVTNHLEAGQLNDGEVDIYLCGPPPMVEAVNQYLRDKGVKPASFHYEKFAASA